MTEKRGKMTEKVPEPVILFNEKCPVCGGEMAKGNQYCSLRCYKTGENL